MPKEKANWGIDLKISEKSLTNIVVFLVLVFLLIYREELLILFFRDLVKKIK